MPETAKLPIDKIVTDIVGTIEREREQEIISRRFGLQDRKETLEQIGELLGITRERVRQLEKAVVARLKSQADSGNLPHIAMVQDALIELLGNLGSTARTSELSARLTKENTRIDQSRISFLAQLCPKVVVVDANAYSFHAAALKGDQEATDTQKPVQAIMKTTQKLEPPP